MSKNKYYVPGTLVKVPGYKAFYKDGKAYSAKRDTALTPFTRGANIPIYNLQREIGADTREVRGDYLSYLVNDINPIPKGSVRVPGMFDYYITPDRKVFGYTDANWKGGLLEITTSSGGEEVVAIKRTIFRMIPGEKGDTSVRPRSGGTVFERLDKLCNLAFPPEGKKVIVESFNDGETIKEIAFLEDIDAS